MALELFQEAYTEEALRAVPTLTLAHVGDGVYELLARSQVVREGVCRVEDAHRRTVELVRAQAQAKAMEALLPMLDEWENAVFHRGRNAHPHTLPRHCAPREYALATGLEALFGALYLTGRLDRLAAVWSAAQEALK
ncbi:MAG: ribonuclease III [Clostridia bacterium]|nr:ribonuclease III [Clostridia bacterium]